MVVAKAKPHHAQKPYILEITKNAPVPGAFLCSMKDIRVSGIALRNAVSALRRSSHACGRVSPYRLGQPVKATGYTIDAKKDVLSSKSRTSLFDYFKDGV